MKQFVRIYDNALPSTLCEGLMHLFEPHESFDNPVYRFKQMNLNQNEVTKKVLFEEIAPIVGTLLDSYDQQIPDHIFPEQFGYEEFRLKCYRPNDYFHEHVDVANKTTAKRFLSIFFYINESGGTWFGDDFIEAKQGRAVVFPPMWMFPHRGEVGEDDKYFLSTYLHYL